MSSVTGDGAGYTHAAAAAAAAGGEVLLNQDHSHGNSPNSLSSVTTHSSGSSSSPQEIPQKKKRNQPGNPDPKAQVIAMSPKSLLATHRFICEVCKKGFQRDQNLQLHRRGHNLPWKLKVNKDNNNNNNNDNNNNAVASKKKVYVCPVLTCVHNNPTRALGDLTGIKKHYCRKHGEKRFRCDRCSKRYAVQSDWKAHTKICGTKDHKCDCGTIFSRKDSYETHRAFCDAIMKESERDSNLELIANLVSENLMSSLPNHSNGFKHNFEMSKQSVQMVQELMMENNNPPKQPLNMATTAAGTGTGSMFSSGSAVAALGGLFAGAVAGGGSFAASKSATAVLQKATQVGATGSDEFGGVNSPLMMSNKGATTMAGRVTIPSFLMQPQTTTAADDDDDGDHHGGFVNLLLNKQQNPQRQEIPSQFLLPINPNGGPTAGHGQHHDIGGFRKYQAELDLPNNPFMKKYDQDENVNNTNTNSFLFGATNSESSQAAAAVGGGGGGANSYVLPHGLPPRFGAERMTVDFLGIGGASRPRGGVNLQDHLDMEFNGGIGQPMMQRGVSQFHHHAPAAMKKLMWEI